MEFKDRDYYPGQWQNAALPMQDAPKKHPTTHREKRRAGRCSVGFVISLVCVVAAVSILLTFTLTNAANRHYYNEELARQQAVIEELRKADTTSTADFEQLELLAKIYQAYSYYAGDVSNEELLTAVMKAYALATGDDYAEYYTEEEFAAFTADREGEQSGIGVSIVQTTLQVAGFEYPVFQVIAVYRNSPAEAAGVQIGDCIYSVKADGTYQTVAELGYTNALTLMQGARGTQAEFAAFRTVGAEVQSLEFSITRDDFEAQSVIAKTAENDPTVGIVHISSFDFTTPHQFKEAVKSLQANGVEHFVFDVRNNPGGDLQSIKAVLTYFLQPGDLILSAIDRKGNVAASYVAEAMFYTDEYAACNVAKNEIGMFANLDMVVLCNENTASAAEVFTATLRDYGLAEIVGTTTFGKGIMQTFIPLSAFGDYTGYAKMTTYAYVTKCGVTYHEIGIEPDISVALSEEALQYNFYVLPQSLDDQLQAAIEQLG